MAEHSFSEEIYRVSLTLMLRFSKGSKTLDELRVLCETVSGETFADEVTPCAMVEV